MFVKRGYAASLLLRLLRDYDGVNGHLVLARYEMLDLVGLSWLAFLA